MQLLFSIQTKVIKERVRACVEGSISSRKRPNIKRRSCSKRFNRCDRNDECREIFEEVPRECNSMLNNEKCTKGCEKALTNFFDHPSARKVILCHLHVYLARPTGHKMSSLDILDVHFGKVLPFLVNLIESVVVC